jgi:hypothetical protein
VDALAQLIDDTGSFVTERERQSVDVVLFGEAHDERVGVAHAGGGDLHLDAAGSRFGRLNLDDFEGRDLLAHSLNQGVLQQLFDPLLLRGAGRDQVDPVPGQVTQDPDRWRWHEAWPQHLAFSDFTQPDRV